jgi:hypothetical protein
MNNFGWDFFEDIYENTLKKGQTFSYEMGEEIKKELDKMYKQREEWLKKKQEEGNEATTENGTD